MSSKNKVISFRDIAKKKLKLKTHTLESADIYPQADISRELTIDELELVSGGMPRELFSLYRASLINESR
jgi:hypothetical protein